LWTRRLVAFIIA